MKGGVPLHPVNDRGIPIRVSLYVPLSLLSIHRNNYSVRYKDDQTALSTSHLKVDADLGAVVLKGVWRWIHVALPVNHCLGRSVRTEDDSVNNARRRLLVRIALTEAIDRKLRHETRPEDGNLRQRQGAEDAASDLGRRQTLRRIVQYG